MPSIQNKYTNGLNKDLAFSKLSNNNLANALNINIITNEGSSTGIIENHKGNKLSFALPTVNSKYTIDVLTNLIGVGYSIFSPAGNFNGFFPNITTGQQLITYLTGTYPTVFPSMIQMFIKDDIVYFQEGRGVINFAVSATYSKILLVPAQLDLSIIGWGQLNEDLIVFTCDKSQTDPDPIGNGLSYYGQIWKVNYDQETNAVPNLINTNQLSHQFHLAYNGRLNFSLANEIYRENIGRIESSDIGNIYWTDNYNPPRVINVYNPNAQTIEEGLLDWKPDVNYSIAIMQQMSEGGSLPPGVIQVTYRHVTYDGAVSNYAPLSVPVNLTDSQFIETFEQYYGADPSVTNSNKAVRYKIDGLDTRYDFIEIIAVFYTLQNVPVPYKVLELPFNSSSIEFTITGNEPKIAKTINEIVSSIVPFDTVKTFTQKKNRLYPANVTKKNFKLNYDARAYRFNSGSICRLYSRDNTFQDFTTIAQLAALPDDADAVNCYNDESASIYGLNAVGAFDVNYTAWLANCQYKFQSDGVTLGGEGPNVSYTFEPTYYQGDNNIPELGVSRTVATSPEIVPFINVDANTNPPIVLATGTNQSYPVTSPYNSIKSPYQAYIQKTFARGEVYRAGIVGINEKGEESFVEWIGDIRCPEPWEDSRFFLSRLPDSTTIEMISVNIKFTVNTATLFANNDDIVGFKILFVERTEADKTKVSMGAVTGICPLIPYTGGAYSPFGTGIIPSGQTGADNSIPQILMLANNFNAPGNNWVQQYVNFGFNDPVPNTPIDNQLFSIYKSPNHDFNGLNTTGGYYKELQWYKTEDDFGPSLVPVVTGISAIQGRLYWDVATPDVNFHSGAVYYKFREAFLPIVATPNNVIHGLKNSIYLGEEQLVPPSFDGFMNGYTYAHITKWETYTVPNEDPSLSGIGSRAIFSTIDVTMPFVVNAGYTQNALPQLYDYKRICSYCKYNFGQYGGPYRENRYSNTYAVSSAFISKNDTSASQDIQVNGDVFMVYYDCVLSSMHWSNADTTDAVGTDLRGFGNAYRKADVQLATALVFPTECDINSEMRLGKHWAKDQVVAVNGFDFANFLFDEFTYNPVYQQQNNLKTYISQPFNTNFTEELPYIIYASNLKNDGEILDSWRQYTANNSLSVEGVYGEINKIVNWAEKILAYQERAMSIVSTQEKGTVQNETGAIIQTGTGDILSRNDYISKDTGTIHQHSVVVTSSGVMHADARLRKVFMLGAAKQGDLLESLTDVKGLSAFFRDNIDGTMLDQDTVIFNNGIHGVYDPLYNKTYMTFEKNINGLPVSFTIAYNHYLDAFESFYSFTPHLYISLGRRLLSTNSDDTVAYIHNIGNYGEFYGQIFNSQFEFIVNGDPTSLLTFRTDWTRWWTQVEDPNGLNVNETISTLRFKNDYQDTGVINCVRPKIKQFERGWSLDIIRDNSQSFYVRPYLRDKYVRIIGTYDNANNYRFRLHDFSTFITPSYPNER